MPSDVQRFVYISQIYKGFKSSIFYLFKRCVPEYRKLKLSGLSPLGDINFLLFSSQEGKGVAGMLLQCPKRPKASSDVVGVWVRLQRAFFRKLA